MFLVSWTNKNNNSKTQILPDLAAAELFCENLMKTNDGVAGFKVTLSIPAVEYEQTGFKINKIL